MPNLVKTLSLTKEETAELKNILRRSTIDARTYIRTKILLLKADGYSNNFIADKLDITVPTVRLCIKKYTEGGIDAAIRDSKGRGRKPEITDSDITWVINKACKKPKEFGYTAQLWYPAGFTHFINSIADKEGHPRMATVTESTLRKIMANAKMRPLMATYYCERRNPR